MVGDIDTGFKPLCQQLFHHRALQRPHQIAGADTACRADTLSQRRHIDQRITIVRAVINAVGTHLKKALSAGVLACQVAGVFDRRQSDCGAAHLVCLNGKVYREVVVSRYRTDHNDIFRQNIGSAQHIIRKSGNAVISDDAARRRRAIPHRVLDFTGDLDGLYRHHTTGSTDGLKHQHMPGVHNVPCAAFFQAIRNFIGSGKYRFPLGVFCLGQHVFHGRKILIH